MQSLGARLYRGLARLESSSKKGYMSSKQSMLLHGQQSVVHIEAASNATVALSLPRTCAASARG